MCRCKERAQATLEAVDSGRAPEIVRRMVNLPLVRRHFERVAREDGPGMIPIGRTGNGDR